jgi:hypothetical protein
MPRGRLSGLGDLPLTRAAGGILQARGAKQERAFRREQFEFQKAQATQAQQESAINAATNYAKALAEVKRQERAADDANHSRAITNIKIGLASFNDDDMTRLLIRESEALGGVYDDLDFRGREKELGKDLVKINDDFEKNVKDPNRERILQQQLLTLQDKYPKRPTVIAAELEASRKRARRAELIAKPAFAAQLDKAGPFARDIYINTGAFPGRAPAERTREITTVGEAGQPVTRIVSDVPGQEFARPPKERPPIKFSAPVPGQFTPGGDQVTEPVQAIWNADLQRYVIEPLEEGSQLRAAPSDVKFREGVPKVERKPPVSELELSKQRGFVDGLTEAGKALAAQPFTKAEDRQLKEMLRDNTDTITRAIKANPSKFPQTSGLTQEELEALSKSELKSIVESILIDTIKGRRVGQ